MVSSPPPSGIPPLAIGVSTMFNLDAIRAAAQAASTAPDSQLNAPDPEPRECERAAAAHAATETLMAAVQANPITGLIAVQVVTALGLTGIPSTPSTPAALRIAADALEAGNTAMAEHRAFHEAEEAKQRAAVEHEHTAGFSGGGGGYTE